MVGHSGIDPEFLDLALIALAWVVGINPENTPELFGRADDETDATLHAASELPHGYVLFRLSRARHDCRQGRDRHSYAFERACRHFRLHEPFPTLALFSSSLRGRGKAWLYQRLLRQKE